MKIFNDPIPHSKMHDFHNILKATNGRYLENPVQRTYEPKILFSA